jgi:hypothetical protein
MPVKGKEKEEVTISKTLSNKGFWLLAVSH